MSGGAAVNLSAYLLITSRGIEDQRLARQVVTTACLDGDPHGAAILGQLWSEGVGGERSDEIAAQLFTLGAEAGSSYAAWKLGLAYMTGRGVKQDPAMGYFWLCASTSLPSVPPEAADHRDAAAAFLSPEQARRIVLAVLRWRPDTPAVPTH